MSSRICSFSHFRTILCIQLIGCVIFSFLGCAGMLSKYAVGNPDLASTNYALASNGGTVTVSGENVGHPAETLNNGITASDLWDQGEGWEFSFVGSLMNSARSVFRNDESRVRNTAMGWVIVEFPKPMVINRVVIHTLDSERYPASKYGVRDLSIFIQEEDDSPWFLVEPRVRNIGVKSGRFYGNKSGVIDCRIKSRQAKRVRVLVEETNDTKQITPWSRIRYTDNYQWFSALSRRVDGTVRLVEVETYGAEKVVGSQADDLDQTTTDLDQSADDLSQLFEEDDLDRLFGGTEPGYETSRLKPEPALQLGVQRQVQLGIRGQEISADIAEKLGLASDYGILLLGLVEGTPAAEKRAEIKIGERRKVYQGAEYLVDSDILVDIDGVEVRGAKDIKQIMADKKAGDIIKLGIVSSSGQRKNVLIYLVSESGDERRDRDKSAQSDEQVGNPEPAEPPKSSPPSQTDSGGKSAPSFVLRNLNGESVNFADFKGKVIILDFWATWCPPCVKEIPHFIELYREYKDQGLAVVGISVDRGTTSTVKSFVGRHQVNYPILMADMKVQQAYGGIRSIPTTFVIDKAGKIRQKYIGYRDKPVFEADIRTLLAEE